MRVKFEIYKQGRTGQIAVHVWRFSLALSFDYTQSDFVSFGAGISLSKWLIAYVHCLGINLQFAANFTEWWITEYMTDAELDEWCKAAKT